MNDRERKDNELGIDLDMKGLTLDSDEAAKPQAQNRPMSHEDMARMIAKNMAMQDGGFDEPITPVRGVSDLARKLSSLKSPKQLKHAVKMQSLHQSRLQRAAQGMEKRRKRSPRQERLSQ